MFVFDCFRLMLAILLGVLRVLSLGWVSLDLDDSFGGFDSLGRAGIPLVLEMALGGVRSLVLLRMVALIFGMGSLVLGMGSFILGMLTLVLRMVRLLGRF